MVLCSPSRSDESGQAGGCVLTCSGSQKKKTVEYTAIAIRSLT